MSGDESKAPVSAVVIAYNEEENLSACLESLVGWVREIFIVDSGSTDGTLDIAGRYGARVYSHRFETYSKQWNWALTNLPITGEWVLGLDADQRVSQKLQEEIARVLPSSDASIHGYYILRHYLFHGRWLRHGGIHPKYQLKLFRYGKGHSDESELLDHHFYVAGGTAKLQGEIIEENRKELDLSFWLQKHLRHSTFRAKEEFCWRHEERAWPLRPALFGNADQRVFWLRRMWLRLPLLVRPFLMFFYRYIFQGGFLDGKQGLIFHFGLSLWSPIAVDLQVINLSETEAAGYDSKTGVTASKDGMKKVPQ